MPRKRASRAGGRRRCSARPSRSPRHTPRARARWSAPAVRNGRANHGIASRMSRSRPSLFLAAEVLDDNHPGRPVPHSVAVEAACVVVCGVVVEHAPGAARRSRPVLGSSQQCRPDAVPSGPGRYGQLHHIGIALGAMGAGWAHHVGVENADDEAVEPTSEARSSGLLSCGCCRPARYIAAISSGSRTW